MVSARQALAEADRLEADGRLLDAISILTAADRVEPDAALERALVRLRHEAFAPVEPPEAVTPAVQAEEVPSGPLPELRPDELDIESLRTGMARHGCVLIRGLIPAEVVDALKSGIDAAFDAFDAGVDGAPVSETEPWYVPFEPRPGTYRIGGRRKWMREGGGIWTVDSPKMLFLLTEVIRDLGIDRLVEDFLGERPALSANKCNLRKAAPGNCGDWHQDGAFLDGVVRSLNLWMALSPCGTNAPTMDIVPRRLDELARTGTEGTYFDWAVAPDVAEEVAGGPDRIIRPSFDAGDAMLFDHLFLHRTAASVDMPDVRYAIETWFFAPSNYPAGQIPLAL
jgi:hypothetical protein